MPRLLLVVFLLFLLLCGFLGRRAYQHPLAVHEVQVVVVEHDAPFASLVKGLDELHAVSHPFILRCVLTLLYKKDSLKAGEYHVHPDELIHALILRIQAGKVVRHHFLIVEGWTIQRVLDKMAKTPSFQQTLGTSNKGLMSRLGLKERHPEGLFFPDTYLYRRGASDKKILLMAYHKMQQVLHDAWKHRSKDLAYHTPYQALIAASLIEKETARAKERPLIAAVINNRLRKGMSLQIDQSVVYGLHVPYGSTITRSMLKKPTQYNVYLNKGLPPTPISLPSKASIVAACHPAKSSVLYYVVRGDGTQQFSTTYQGQKLAVKALRHREAKERLGLPTLNAFRELACVSLATWDWLGGKKGAQKLTKLTKVVPFFCQQKEARAASTWYHQVLTH